MLGLGDYGSGSESDDDDVQTKAPTSSVKSQSLPKPSSRPTSGLPPTRTKKKIAITLPSLKSTKDDKSDDDVQQPPAKKQRLESGAGLSSLLSMLPAPKQKNPIPAAPARVLGGGSGGWAGAQTLVAEPVAPESSDAPIPFLPPSLAKGRSNISLEDERPRKAAVPSAAPAVDFFSLGSSSTSASTTPTSKPIASSSVSISSAPAIPTFEPPEPTPNDEYPGYYQLPSGQWAAHDPDYYTKFAKKWQREYDAHVRALEKGAGKGFENLESSDVANVDAAQEMERAKKEIKEREDRKKISMGTDGEPAKPKMNINASKLSGIARSRHQLSTLLKEAYENREALEDRIAEGRRNRKEAGNKYGF